MERKLASVRKIEEIKKIEGADKIVAYRVDGWWVVDSIDKYKVGDLVIYIEPDAWVPTELAPFLTKGKAPREYNGVKGEKLRTVKLRGQISQGLLLPLNDQMIISANLTEIVFEKFDDVEGMDVTEKLGIQKWEPTIAENMRGLIKSTFPSFIRKTDQERIQNIKHRDLEQHKNDMFEVSIKLDGTSFTAYNRDGEVGVCSRNQDLKLEGNDSNVYVGFALRTKILEFLLFHGKNIAIQGELMGPGIQDNREGLNEVKLFVFDVFNIDTGSYMNHGERINLLADLKKYMANVHNTMNYDTIQSIPIMSVGNKIGDNTVETFLADAEGKSLNHPVREGIVWKSITDPGFSFKAISNVFLLGEK